MPHSYDYDHTYTQYYLPKISSEPNTPPELIPSYEQLEKGYVHEGRRVDPTYLDKERIIEAFRYIYFDCLVNIHEPIYPRFILEFYSSVKIIRDENHSIHIHCRIGHHSFQVSLEKFAQALGLPCYGQCSFSEEFDLNSLEKEHCP